MLNTSRLPWMRMRMHRSDEWKLLQRMLISHSTRREEAGRICMRTPLSDHQEALK